MRSTTRSSDVFGGSDTGAVTVQVSPRNDPPVAVDDSASTNEDVAVDVAVLANDTDVDGDALSVTGVSGATNGTATINPNGTVRFAPTANASGSGSFQYTVSDGAGGSDAGAVSVTINPVNDAPVAVNDSATTAQGVPVTISVLANDTDIDSGALSSPASAIRRTARPSPTPTAPSRTRPTPGYSGPDAFAYTASDGSATEQPRDRVDHGDAGAAGQPVPHRRPGSAGVVSGKTWTARVTHPRPQRRRTATWRRCRHRRRGAAAASGSASCTTATNGTCTVQMTKLSRTAVASVTFTVISGHEIGLDLRRGAQPRPGTDDSTGTVIVVPRP